MLSSASVLAKGIAVLCVNLALSMSMALPTFAQLHKGSPSVEEQQEARKSRTRNKEEFWWQRMNPWIHPCASWFCEKSTAHSWLYSTSFDRGFIPIKPKTKQTNKKKRPPKCPIGVNDSLTLACSWGNSRWKKSPPSRYRSHRKNWREMASWPGPIQGFKNTSTLQRHGWT